MKTTYIFIVIISIFYSSSSTPSSVERYRISSSDYVISIHFLNADMTLDRVRKSGLQDTEAGKVRFYPYVVFSHSGPFVCKIFGKKDRPNNVEKAFRIEGIIPAEDLILPTYHSNTDTKKVRYIISESQLIAAIRDI